MTSHEAYAKHQIGKEAPGPESARQQPSGGEDDRNSWENIQPRLSAHDEGELLSSGVLPNERIRLFEAVPVRGPLEEIRNQKERSY